MSRKRELLLMELENKKLDIDIKLEALEKARLDSRALKSRIEDVEVLRRQVYFQEQDLKSLRTEKARLLTDIRHSEATIEQLLQNEREMMFSFPMRVWRWFRNFKNKAKNGFRTIQKPIDPVSVRNVNILSPEVARMSADEFKKKYIDSVVL